MQRVKGARKLTEMPNGDAVYACRTAGSKPRSARRFSLSLPSSIRSAAASPATACAETLQILGRSLRLCDPRGSDRYAGLRLDHSTRMDIRDAYIKNERGERVVDFRDAILHVLNYSTPVHARLPLEELKPHIFTLPDQPDLIPYRTSYYAERWGFCMSHDQLDGAARRRHMRR